MNDAVLVRGIERVGNLPRDRERFSERDRSVCQAVRQRRSLDQLEDERADRIRLLQAVDVADVRMGERGEHLCLALEAGKSFGIAGEGIRQNLQRHVTLEPRIAGAVDLAHAARAEQGGHLVDADTRPGRQRHRWADYTVRPYDGLPAEAAYGGGRCEGATGRLRLCRLRATRNETWR